MLSHAARSALYDDVTVFHGVDYQPPGLPASEANYMYPYAATQDRLTLRFTDEGEGVTLTFYREG